MTKIAITIWLHQVQTFLDVETQNEAQIYRCLCSIDPYLITFRDTDYCIDYITDLDDDVYRVLLIISNNTLILSSDLILQLSGNLLLIDSIFILNSNKWNSIDSCETFCKVRGIHGDLDSLLCHLKQSTNIKRHRRNTSDRSNISVGVWSRLDSYISSINEMSSLISSNKTERQEAEFMYASFLRDILIEIESSKEELVNFCRQKCVNDESQLKYIDEFKGFYRATDAIFWYTRDTFLYRLLNQALREQDIGTLYSLRYFIKDLHFQLKERQKSQQMTSASVYRSSSAVDRTLDTVYRGQLMGQEEFDKKLRYNIGGFFSVNSFLSTTKHRDLAVVYAGNRSTHSTSALQSVLFQIDIDTSVNKFSYANISTESAFEEDEEEILFTMGTIFRIESVNLSSQGFWDIHLKLTSDEDEELRILTEHLREEVLLRHPLTSLAKLMSLMGNFEKAEQFHFMLLEEPTIMEDMNLLYQLYCNLGYVYNKTSQMNKAIEYLQKAVDIIEKHLPEHDYLLALPYTHLTENYYEQCDYEKALSYCHKAIEFELNAPEPRQIQIAALHENLGAIYEAQLLHFKALEMYKKCLDIRLKMLPSNHPYLANSYNNISLVYFEIGAYDKAVENINKAIQNQLNSLVPTHPLLAISYNNLGLPLFQQGKVTEALAMFELSLEILLKSSPPNYRSLALTYNNLATIHSSTDGDPEKALKYLNKTLKIQLNSLTREHRDFATTYNNFGLAFSKQGKFEEALAMFNKSLEIKLMVLPANHPAIAVAYSNISHVYDEQDDIDKAIDYINKALEIQQMSVPPNHSQLATTYNYLGSMYQKQNKFKEALELYEKAVEIELKTVPTNTSSLQRIYKNISNIYYTHGDYYSASIFFRKILELELNSTSINYSNAATAYNNLGAALYKQGQFKEALITYEKSLQIRSNIVLPDYSGIISSYESIAQVYRAMGETDKVIEYLCNGLKIMLKFLEPNNPKIAIAYKHIALLFYHQGNLKAALENMNKKYEIDLINLGLDHPEVLEDLKNIIGLGRDLLEQLKNEQLQ